MRASSFKSKKTNGLAGLLEATQLDLFDHRVSDHTEAARLLCSHHAPKARCMMNTRQNKGLAIAQQAEVVRQGNVWIVPSQTRLCNYTVDLFQNTCTCPDYKENGGRCKHLYAVEFQLRRESGEVLPPPEARKTYSQEWHEYNLAQTNEKARFLELLYGLCAGVNEPVQTMGRPRMAFSDMVFCAAYKIYSQFSTRRFNSDLMMARERGYIARVPHFNTMIKYLDLPEMTPYLKRLIVESALPLKAVEWDFAVDSSGFSTGTPKNKTWAEAKWANAVTLFGERVPNEVSRTDWLKAHVMCGVKTNIVTSVEITGADGADSPQFAPLVETTSRGFPIQSVCADKAYSAEKNLKLVLIKGGMPYVDFKSSTTGTSKGEVWKKMFHFYQYNRETFMQHYHRRSNVESTFSMIKAKFGERVRSKTQTGQTNEVLCKILCHNICCLIHSVYELGIELTFWEED
jgi:Transposase DDE domain/SWIM zinc finger